MLYSFFGSYDPRVELVFNNEVMSWDESPKTGGNEQGLFRVIGKIKVDTDKYNGSSQLREDVLRMVLKKTGSEDNEDKDKAIDAEEWDFYGSDDSDYPNDSLRVMNAIHGSHERIDEMPKGSDMIPESLQGVDFDFYESS